MRFFPKRKKKKKIIKEDGTKEEVIIKQPPKEQFAPAKFFPARNCALVFTQTDIFLVPCNVYDDGTLEYEVPQTLKNTQAFKDKFKEEKRKKATIFRPPHVFEFPCRSAMPTSMSRFLSPEYLRFRVWCVNPQNNVTFDPSVDTDELDKEVIEKFKALLKLKVKTEKVDWTGNLAKGMEGKKKMTEWLGYILWFLTILAFLFIYEVLPMWAGG